MVAPMVALMRFRGLTPTSVYPAAYYGMLLGMIAVMVYRRGMYASRDETAAAWTSSLTPASQTGSLT